MVEAFIAIPSNPDKITAPMDLVNEISKLPIVL
jgi:hypothetical protein